tara:strand:- start:78 stop:377 length:300 start_codon:yes stop_codon:yes gene_type:complete
MTGCEVDGKVFSKRVGSRAEVGHGTAYKTTGGLTKSKLVLKNGRWKSKKAVAAAIKVGKVRLQKLGLLATKGAFGPSKKKPAKKRRVGKKVAGKKSKGC